MSTPNPKREAEKVIKSSVARESGYLYFIDEDGDIARVPAKWNKDPQFLEKVANDQQMVDERLKQMSENYAPQEEEFEEPIPATESGIPYEFMDKKIIYLDNAAIGTIEDNSLCSGHCRISMLFKSNIATANDDEFVHSQTVASFTASILFETLKAQGTNIIINQENEFLTTSVIPRFQEDGIDLLWELKKGDDTKIKSYCEKIKSALIIGEKKDHTKINLDEPKEEPKPDIGAKKTNIIDREQLKKDEFKYKEPKNYMLEHLRRDN